MTRVEFWPDYGSGRVWNDDGRPVDLESLGISPGLAARVRLWDSAYAEDKLPLDGLVMQGGWPRVSICCSNCAMHWAVASTSE